LAIWIHRDLNRLIDFRVQDPVDESKDASQEVGEQSLDGLHQEDLVLATIKIPGNSAAAEQTDILQAQQTLIGADDDALLLPVQHARESLGDVGQQSAEKSLSRGRLAPQTYAKNYDDPESTLHGCSSSF
jgi:hypothetical protein